MRLPGVSTNMSWRIWISCLLIGFIIAGPVTVLRAQDAAPAEGAKNDEFGLPMVTVVGNDTPTQLVSAQLKQAGYDVTFTGKAAGQKITIMAQDEPILSVLNQLVAGKGWQWDRKGERSFEIMDTATYEATVLPRQIQEYVIVPENLKASEVAKAVEGVVDKKIGESVTADDRTNKVLVKALPATIEQIQRFVQEVDHDFSVRVFRIRYADPTTIAEKLETLKSDPGTIEVDEINHQIVVRDLFRNIQKMEAIIAIYDQQPEMKVYQLNTVEFEDDNVDTLIALLQERILTTDAFIDVNRNTGQLVVEDVPEVQDKVAQLLEVFDAPLKQVVIHAEIIETNFNKGLNYGLETKASRDLFSAANDGLFKTRGGSDVSTSGTAGAGIPAINTGLDKLGFSNFYREFPTVGVGAGGLAIEYLTENAHFLFSAAITDDETRVLSQPRIMVKNKESAFLRVGGAVAYRTTQNYGYSGYNNNSNYGGYNNSSQAQREYGLILDFTVTITNDDICELDINLKNDQVQLRGTDDNPLVDTTGEEFETIMRIPSGETRVLAGLLSTKAKNSSQGVPLLSSIPWIGPMLFGKKSNSEEMRNLMVFITPVVVKDDARKRRPAVSIEEMTALAASTDDATLTNRFRRDTAASMRERMQEYRKDLSVAREGDMSVLGLTPESEVKTEELLPPAIPADTPDFRELPSNDGDTSDSSTSDTEWLIPPPPPPDDINKKSSAAAPLLSESLEPLKVADHTTSPTGATADGDKSGFPQSSYVHTSTGAITMPAGGGAKAPRGAPGGVVKPPTRTPATRTPPKITSPPTNGGGEAPPAAAGGVRPATPVRTPIGRRATPPQAPNNFGPGDDDNGSPSSETNY